MKQAASKENKHQEKGAPATEPLVQKKRLNPLFGRLKGTVRFVAADFDEPLKGNEWEAGEKE